MHSYRVSSGDTLSSIAARQHTTVSALQRANGLSNANQLRAGRALRVPGHGTADTFVSHAHASGAGAAGLPHGSQALASAGRRVAMRMGGYHSHSRCAEGVSRAIHDATGLTVTGNGNQIDDHLPRSRFKQVNLSLKDALKVPGLVLTWEHTSTRAGRRYGHTAITTGDGHSSSSDFFERNTLASSGGRSGLKVFAPI